MKIKVLFFAQLKDRAGVRERIFDIADHGLTVEDFANGLCETDRDLPLAYAINDEFVKPDHVLHDGDVVALVPPVAGG